jgi:hypothetical protein
MNSGILGGITQPTIAARPRPMIAVIKKIAIARGADPAKVDEAIAIAESETPIRDWLLNGGLEKLIELILKIIAVL